MGTEVRILKYHLKYKADFIHLNYEWLNAYFEIEPYDRQVLEDCENHILAKGGHIFFALYNDQVVGTFAYLKHEEGVYELSKWPSKNPSVVKGWAINSWPFQSALPSNTIGKN